MARRLLELRVARAVAVVLLQMALRVQGTTQALVETATALTIVAAVGVRHLMEAALLAL